MKEGLKKMVTTVQSFESKPQIVLVTPPPLLSCPNCLDRYPDTKGLVLKANAHISKKLPIIYEEVAKETNVKLLNLYETFKGKDE